MAGAIWPTDYAETDLVKRDFSQPWDLSDIAFITEKGKKVHACKTIMAMWSPVMKAMFFGIHNFREKKAQEIKLPGKSYQEILELVRVLHPPNKELDANNIAIILPLAQEYQMELLTKRCERFLLNKAPSVLSLVMAEEFSLLRLQDQCMDYLRRTRLHELTRERAFGELSNETKVDLLMDKSMHYEQLITEMQHIAEGWKPDQMQFRIGGTLCTYGCPDKEHRSKVPHNAGTKRTCKSCAVSMMNRIWQIVQSTEGNLSQLY